MFDMECAGRPQRRRRFGFPAPTGPANQSGVALHWLLHPGPGGRIQRACCPKGLQPRKGRAACPHAAANADVGTMFKLWTTARCGHRALPRLWATGPSHSPRQLRVKPGPTGQTIRTLSPPLQAGKKVGVRGCLLQIAVHPSQKALHSSALVQADGQVRPTRFVQTQSHLVKVGQPWPTLVDFGQEKAKRLSPGQARSILVKPIQTRLEKHKQLEIRQLRLTWQLFRRRARRPPALLQPLPFG